jgi:hypothetical protein
MVLPLHKLLRSERAVQQARGRALREELNIPYRVFEKYRSLRKTMTESRPRKPESSDPSAVAFVIFLNVFAFPGMALAAATASFEVLEAGGFPAAVRMPDPTNFNICVFFFVLIAVFFVLADLILVLRLKHFTDLKAWAASLATPVLPPLAIFAFLVFTGTSPG